MPEDSKALLMLSDPDQVIKFLKLNRSKEEDLSDDEKDFLSDFRNNTNLID